MRGEGVLGLNDPQMAAFRKLMRMSPDRQLESILVPSHGNVVFDNPYTGCVCAWRWDGKSWSELVIPITQEFFMYVIDVKVSEDGNTLIFFRIDQQFAVYTYKKDGNIWEKAGGGQMIPAYVFSGKKLEARFDGNDAFEISGLDGDLDNIQRWEHNGSGWKKSEFRAKGLLWSGQDYAQRSAVDMAEFLVTGMHAVIPRIVQAPGGMDLNPDRVRMDVKKAGPADRRGVDDRAWQLPVNFTGLEPLIIDILPAQVPDIFRQ